MPQIDLSEYKKQLKSGALSGVIFLHGRDEYRKEAALSAAKKQISGPNALFNLVELDGSAPDLSALEAAVDTPPVFAKKKCITLPGLNPEKLKSDELNTLLTILEDFPSESHLLLISCPDEHFQPKKSAKCRKLLAACEKSGLSVEISLPSAREISLLLAGTAKAYGSSIDPELCRMLAELCGSDMQAVMREGEKLLALAAGRAVTREDIAGLVTPAVEADAFSLSAAILRKDLKEANRLLDALFYRREEPVMILGALSSAFVDIYRVKIAQGSKHPPRELAALYSCYKGREFRLDKAARLSSGTDLRSLRLSLDLLARADLALKSSRQDPQTLLTVLFCELAELRSR
ncbi:MAG: DNA polymerase III subunit delta [Ruminococcaceae bacterium]|nr:DNA polymerase III subunit delta [Oscillospiraceae bacterium]